ncbi:DUF6010 family protein [Cryobacterium sp. TMT4-31]|uniref:DUF6010 family protein n=1 Tax=Cryobacterium sp. TMT4-31 TaxID=1259259 RepID=UPI00106C9710|nr:DUF6010 family protein [Cryobacterium sp. TMT4-31]TFC86376.1 hypothetical protein E3T19_15470 [Cryobacterium sp. TMT4-31]
MTAFAPILIGIGIVLALSLIPYNHRRNFGAILVAGAGAAYLSSGTFGPWELVFTSAMTIVAFMGLRSNRWIGVAWLMHTAWDTIHAMNNSPILPFAPHSSLGCAICDPVIALWYFADAPSMPEILRALRARASRKETAEETVVAPSTIT